MQTLAPAVSAGTATAADRLARQYWESNRCALSRTQPIVVSALDEVRFEHEWVFARDGSLSALENGRWWADCSVPLLAGRSLLKSLGNESIGSCQLAPFHAGLVRAARERMGASSVLFVAQPDIRVARMILSCHDFSELINRHRFWIAAGDQWLSHIEQMFTDNPGLATPLRFVRTRLTPEEVTLPMIQATQDILSKVLAARGEQIARLRAEPLPAVSTKKILLVGGTEFRLWDFGARVIEQQLQARSKADGLTINRFDMDDALLGSPSALLSASRECGCVIAADVCRADCNGLVSPEIPWITWMTQAGAPPFDTAGPRDVLILADEKWRAVARVAGWPPERLRVCGWPGFGLVQVNDTAGRQQNNLGFICDTRKITVPAAIADFSSHRLLWELIEEELAANPLAVEDVDAYLTNRAGQLNIATDVLDRQKFADDLILPAYQQGLARLLMAAGISIHIHGKGWGDLPEFASRYRGAISNQTEFQEAIGNCKGLVHCRPARSAHPMQMIGKPILYRSGIDRSALVRSAKAILNGSDPKPAAIHADNQLGTLISQLIV